MPSSIKQLLLALFATLFFGLCGGVIASTFNNYLVEIQNLEANIRGWLEFPRELPGFLMLFVTGFLLFYIRETKMAALAMLFSAVGAAGFSLLTLDVKLLVVFLLIWSLGDHMIFTVEGPIGLQLAREGHEGKRLGQFGGARNLGTIIGVTLVFLISKFNGQAYDIFFGIAALSALIAGVLYLKLEIQRPAKPVSAIIVKKKYTVFYAISALFGIRKQIFLVFGGWLLVKVHGVPVSTIALLYFIASCLGVVFRPLLGEIIDWLGERFILSLDEVILLLVCLTYAFASDLLPKPFDLYLLYTTYVLDSVLFALRVARTTYLKKIADSSSDITPTIAMGISIDHAVAMSLPILSGYVWDTCGYRWVFLIAAAIAVAGFFVCLKIDTALKPLHSTFGPG